MKDYLRDYCTEAFRFYARNGKSTEKYKKKIYQEALEEQKKLERSSGLGDPTGTAILRAEAAVDEKIAEIRDMEAVELTLAELEGRHRHEVVRAVEFVYFKEPKKDLEPGDIGNRVHVAEINIPASERSIYRYLKKARMLFAEHRGLRTETYSKKKKKNKNKNNKS